MVGRRALDAEGEVRVLSSLLDYGDCGVAAARLAVTQEASVGSIPTSHPYIGGSSSGRTRVSETRRGGSNPPPPAMRL